MIVEKGGLQWVESLKKMTYEEARIELQTLCGIGRKVADCICLMGLGFSEAIPVDTHIHQVAKIYLPHVGKAKTLTDKIYSEITDYFRSMYGEYAGWAHSVLFTSRLRHLKTDASLTNKNGEEREDKKSAGRKQGTKRKPPANIEPVTSADSKSLRSTRSRK